MREAVVVIERLCYGGAGFGRVDGKACFVPLTAPGDRVRIRITKEKRSFLEGEVIEVLEPSPLRVAPPCPSFGVCGGCDWQLIPYQEQLAQKKEIFADTLFRIGKVPKEKVLPVSPAEPCYGYRSRVQLKVAPTERGFKVGFYRYGTHEVVDIGEGCAIAAPVLNRICCEFRSLLPGLPEALRIEQVDLAVGDDDLSVAILRLRGGDPGSVAEGLAAMRDDLPSVSGAFVAGGRKDPVHAFGIDSLIYTIPAGLFPGSREMRLRFRRGGFSQVNCGQNLELLRTVWQWAGVTGTERVLDLYCGNGNFSVPLAPYAGEVLGVEGYAPSIVDAVANAEANGVRNASFEVRDAALAVRRLAKQRERFDLVILDPPRAGAESAGDLALLEPQKIIYVSCDPSTLARDLALLGDKGYHVTRSKPVDMFPQTYHVESVTELIRT